MTFFLILVGKGSKGEVGCYWGVFFFWGGRSWFNYRKFMVIWYLLMLVHFYGHIPHVFDVFPMCCLRKGSLLKVLHLGVAIFRFHSALIAAFGISFLGGLHCCWGRSQSGVQHFGTKLVLKINKHINATSEQNCNGTSAASAWCLRRIIWRLPWQCVAPNFLSLDQKNLVTLCAKVCLQTNNVIWTSTKATVQLHTVYIWLFDSTHERIDLRRMYRLKT